MVSVYIPQFKQMRVEFGNDVIISWVLKSYILDIEIPSTWYVYDFNVYDLNFNIYVVTLHLLFDWYYIFSFWLFMIASIIEFYVFLYLLFTS